MICFNEKAMRGEELSLVVSRADTGDADADSAGDADIDEKKGILVSYSNVHLWLDLNTCN